MERSKGEATTTVTAMVPAMKIKQKDRRRSIQSPAGSTMENTPGENAHSTGEVTITKKTVREMITITTEAQIQPITIIGIRATHQAATISMIKDS